VPSSLEEQQGSLVTEVTARWDMVRSTAACLLVVSAVVVLASGLSADETGRIAVEGPPGATILLDGETVGTIPDSAGVLLLEDVSAGAHSVMATSDGCESQVAAIWVAPGSERVARFGPFEPARLQVPGSARTRPRRWGSLFVMCHEQTCRAEIPGLGLSGASSAESPWLADSLAPGRYSARLFIDDFTKDLTMHVRPDTLTQVLVGFDDELVEQRFHAFSTMDTTDLPFDRSGRATGRVRGSACFETVFDEPPQILSQVPPEYPQSARLAELEGVVMVGIGVDESGNVAEADIVGDGILGLNEAALNAVRQWKFEPARRNGVPTRVRIVVPVRFTLRG
jgi:protein TonB